MLLVPEFVKLSHRGKVHGFPDRSAAHGSVANICDDDTLFAVNLLEQRRTRRDVARATDQRIVRIHAERREERMH